MAEIIPHLASRPAGLEFGGGLRLAVRNLRRSPGYTAAVLALLTLGLATGAVVFLILDAVLFRPLPVRAPEQLYRLVTVRPKLGRRGGHAYEVYRNQRLLVGGTSDGYNRPGF